METPGAWGIIMTTIITINSIQPAPTTNKARLSGLYWLKGLSQAQVHAGVPFAETDIESHVCPR